ncbi:(S)-2-haloacid dehalogenase 4A [Aquisphaera giovannonii]|uniref:(S)-2-haloacid dehalogenase 4A n=1 Tax=Aquisphaera giovannonii TaxID=406548 RepID=A0A5B9W3Z4_9BACT|nr:HAD-IIIA family hydrolase [Aquisphaera giovannonii]QEH35333.1 (S)-2-haloacid dehalogenase 4A [Aquisphaera giovannonii]
MSNPPNWDLISGIVFDAVGTLIKPVPSVADVYTDAARRQGVELHRDEVKARFQVHFGSDEVRGDRGIHSTDEATEVHRWRRIVHKVLPEVPDPGRVFDDLWDHFRHPGSWRCFPDVAPALRLVHEAGITVCIGSNFDARLREVVLGHPDLGWALDALVISSEVGYRKPHPKFFEAVCRRLGLAPEQVLCVGDDAENDVRGAMRAGLSAVLLARGGDGPQDLPHIPNLTDLMESRLAEA